MLSRKDLNSAELETVQVSKSPTTDVVTHARPQRASARSGVGNQGNLAPGSLSTGSPASRTPPKGDGSMCSQDYVGALRSCPLMAETSVKMLDGWKGGRPGVRLQDQTCESVVSPKITSRGKLLV